MTLLRPTNTSEILVDDFIQYALTHLNTITGVANTISLYPPLGTPGPGIVAWSGYFVPPPTPSVPTIDPNIKLAYSQLDFTQIPLDINSIEVQEIINPSIPAINEKIIADGNLGADVDMGIARVSQLDNTVAEILDNALYDQGIVKIEDSDATVKSGYKTLDELLKIAGNYAPKLRKNPRIKYETLRSGYIKGIHGLCPQGTQAVVVALTGIEALGKIGGNADWFSFKSPSTGGGRSSFSVSLNGKAYYNDKVNVSIEYVNTPSQWQVGDIIANGYIGTKPYGHIQVWTGFAWVSDFTQRKIQTNNVDFTTLALWRLSELGKQSVIAQSA